MGLTGTSTLLVTMLVRAEQAFTCSSFCAFACMWLCVTFLVGRVSAPYRSALVYKFARLNISRTVHPSVRASLTLRTCLITLEMPLFASLTCFVGWYPRHGVHSVVGLPIVAK